MILLFAGRSNIRRNGFSFWGTEQIRPNLLLGLAQQAWKLINPLLAIFPHLTNIGGTWRLSLAKASSYGWQTMPSDQNDSSYNTISSSWPRIENDQTNATFNDSKIWHLFFPTLIKLKKTETSESRHEKKSNKKRAWSCLNSHPLHILECRDHNFNPDRFLSLEWNFLH